MNCYCNLATLKEGRVSPPPRINPWLIYVIHGTEPQLSCHKEILVMDTAFYIEDKNKQKQTKHISQLIFTEIKL